ncbi:MAG: hypothetical protein L6V80_02715 [Bacteroidales bacterium]|nr:MAG: hypothetical protein L6V80_02715 [Bacteroidales bacterium]
MKRLVYIILAAAMAFTVQTLSAQTAQEKQRIEAQRRKIAELEEQIAQEEKRLSGIKRDKSTAQQRVRSITRQIDARNQILTRTENEMGLITRNIARNDSIITATRVELATERERFGEMVREAYRNYRQNNYITYLLASRDFTDAARRISNIRAVAALRAERMRRIDSLGHDARAAAGRAADAARRSGLHPQPCRGPAAEAQQRRHGRAEDYEPALGAREGGPAREDAARGAARRRDRPAAQAHQGQQGGRLVLALDVEPEPSGGWRPRSRIQEEHGRNRRLARRYRTLDIRG